MTDWSLPAGSYQWIKLLHILSGTLLLGTGFGSAFFKYRVDRIGDLPAIVFASKTVVLVDWLFTAPAVVIQPITGLLLVEMADYSVAQPWLLISLAFYVLAGLCWLPALYLQHRMRDLAMAAFTRGFPLPGIYHHFARLWFWLGVIGFGAVLVIVVLMVLKPS